MRISKRLILLLASGLLCACQTAYKEPYLKTTDEGTVLVVPPESTATVWDFETRRIERIGADGAVQVAPLDVEPNRSTERVAAPVRSLGNGDMLGTRGLGLIDGELRLGDGRILRTESPRDGTICTGKTCVTCPKGSKNCVPCLMLRNALILSQQPRLDPVLVDLAEAIPNSLPLEINAASAFSGQPLESRPIEPSRIRSAQISGLDLSRDGHRFVCGEGGIGAAFGAQAASEIEPIVCPTPGACQAGKQCSVECEQSIKSQCKQRRNRDCCLLWNSIPNDCN